MSSPTPGVALCTAQRPALRDPFPFNRDAGRRDRLVAVPPDADYIGGSQSFEDLDAAGLARLIEENFIDSYDRQNAAPMVWDIFQFLCRYPEVRAGGYVVTLDRPDYRTAIDAVSALSVTPGLRADAERLCTDADEVVVEEYLECFWD